VHVGRKKAILVDFGEKKKGEGGWSGKITGVPLPLRKEHAAGPLHPRGEKESPLVLDATERARADRKTAPHQ